MAHNITRNTGRKLQLRNFQPLARAVMVVSAVAVLATGVTYAALQSQAANLTGNSISTATADLRISTTSSTSSTSFANTKTGFAFSNIIPGAAAVPTDGNLFYLKNFGTAPMALKVAISSTPTNLSSVDLSKVYIQFSRVDTTAVQKLPVASLIASHTTGGTPVTDNLVGGATAQYKTQVVMDDDAFSGASATIGGIDLVFTGLVVTQ
ncbi:MAG TPA: hypothetical protein VF575_00530 [Candidatus Saccharimonadales bacterium]|jgi:hypothetical protein